MRIVAPLVIATLLGTAQPMAGGPPQSEGRQRHRVPAATMTYRGADWLERQERVAEEHPERVIEAMALEPGDVVADVGCATGYFARRMAPRVAPSGTVYCVDIQPEMLRMMERLAAQEGVEGIEPVLSTEDDLRLPDGTIDWIVLADVYHEMAEPEAMLAEMHDALAPGGRVALLEYRLEDGTGDYIKADHRMSARQVMQEWGRAGFELEALDEFLPAQHLFIFRASGSSAETPAIPMRDLVAAVSDGSVEARFSVKDEGTTTVRARSSAPGTTLLTLAAGTSFLTPNGTEVIARRDAAVLITGATWHEAEIRTLARVREAEAAPGTSLTFGPKPLAPPLDRLVHALQAGTYTRPGRSQPLFYPPQTLDVERTAVWIADENPSFDEIAPLVGDDQMSAAYVAAFALVFCDAAGIDITKTALWAERETLFDGLRYPPLTVWYEDKLEQ